MTDLQSAYFDALRSRAPRTSLSRARAVYASIAAPWATSPHAARAFDWHEALIESSLAGWEGAGLTRGASITCRGLPIVYCDKLEAQGNGSLRMVVEPRAGRAPTSEQVEASLRLARGLLGDEGEGAARDLDALAEALLPAGAGARDALFGGIWLGMACSREALALKAYLNCRHCPVEERWERMEQALSAVFAGSPRQALSAPRAAAGSMAPPMGVGVEIEGGEVRAIRAYLTLARPTASDLESLVPASYGPEARRAVRSFARSFEERFGPLGPELASVAYDHRREGDRLSPSPARFKVELCCHELPVPLRDEALDWASDMAALHGPNPPDLATAARCRRAFGEVTPQYTSLGVGPGGAAHVSFYFQPETKDERQAARG